MNIFLGYCGSPGEPLKGSYEYQRHTLEDVYVSVNPNLAYYKCEANHVLVANSKIYVEGEENSMLRCIDGIWDGDVPHCGKFYSILSVRLLFTPIQ